MKLLVVGRDGQLGRSLHEKAGSYPELECAFVGREALDLMIAGAALPVVREHAPDLVINAAAYTAVDRAESEPELAKRINAEGAGELAAAARNAGAAIIQISTDYVFDGRSPDPYPEDAATAPLNVYGRTKFVGEEAVRAANPDHLIVRTSWVYSPFGRNFMKTMLALATDRDEVRVVADQVGNPTSALDFAGSLLRLAMRLRVDRSLLGRTYHLTGQGSCSWAEFAVQIFDVSAASGGPEARVVQISTEDYPTPAERPLNSRLDCCRFEEDLGFSLPHWRDSVPTIVRRLVQAE